MKKFFRALRSLSRGKTSAKKIFRLVSAIFALIGSIFSAIVSIFSALSSTSSSGGTVLGGAKEHYVYLFNAKGTDRYKIGVSKDPDRRATEVQSSHKIKVVNIWGPFSKEEAYDRESTLHNKYGHRHSHNEWFELSNSEVKDLGKLLWWERLIY